MPKKKIDVIEIISTKRKDTPGRVLLLGIKDENLFLAIDNDIALKRRFGTLGLNRNDSPKSFGIPIFSHGKIAYYLLATYLEAQRAVPFRGCLIHAAELHKAGDNLLGFLKSWETFLKNSEPVDLETHMPGMITLEIDEPPVSKAIRSSQKLKKLTTYLKQGKIIRFFEQDKASEFSRFLLSQKDLRFDYSWTEAPFDFPSEPDGAKLHIAVLHDQHKYDRKRSDVIVLDNYAVLKDSNESNKVQPIELVELERIEIKSPLEEPRLVEYQPTRKRSKFIFLLLALLFVLFLVIKSFFNAGAGGCKGETWLRRNLGEISFKQPLPEQIDAVHHAKETLKNPGCKEASIRICKRFMRSKVAKIQELLFDSIKSDWRFIDGSQVVLKKWFGIVKDLEKLDFQRKPNLEDYTSDLLSLAQKGLENFIKAQVKPTSESIKNLNYALSVAEKYPSEFNTLAGLSKQLSGWLTTEMQIRDIQSKGLDYGDFKLINTLLTGSSPPEICKSTFNKLKYDNTKNWTNYQVPRTKSLYNAMIGLEQDFDWWDLSKAFNKLFAIPGQESNLEALEIFDTLKELKQGKIITLDIFNVKFSRYFNRMIKSYKTKKEKRKSDKEAKEDIKIRLRLIFVGRESDSLIIKDKKDFRMPVKVSFSFRLSIEVLLDYEPISSDDLRINLFDDWLKRKDSIEKVVLKDFNKHQIMEFKYRVPTTRQLGLRDWD
ncbi:MAG: hypothetical protein JSV88_20265 [Candidatus Aminicenantes bacterium]|nr:MAG: hypothetical protein JSV88_20265 [Candidatus Aminicenantes bacterium]